MSKDKGYTLASVKRRLKRGAYQYPDNERPADLTLWLQNGCADYSRAVDGVKADTEISIGRTNSKRALGFFVIRKGVDSVDFVLNKDQVADLAEFLQLALSRLQ
jgi:hypothetical protein